MQTSTTFHVTADTRVEGEIIDVQYVGRTMYLKVKDDAGNNLCFILRNGDTSFLDRLANEAERLTREFIGDVPPLEPLNEAVMREHAAKLEAEEPPNHDTGQYCECPDCKGGGYESPSVHDEDMVP